MNNKINEIKIIVPEGMEIDKQNSTFEIIKFKPIKKTLPKSWEELNYIDGYYINNGSEVRKTCDKFSTSDENKNIFPTKELARAALALAQLLQLRDVYNDGWTPDWKSYYIKYSIYCNEDIIATGNYYKIQKVMTFKTIELRDKFFDNFQSLLETAKPLL